MENVLKIQFEKGKIVYTNGEVSEDGKCIKGSGFMVSISHSGLICTIKNQKYPYSQEVCYIKVNNNLSCVVSYKPSVGEIKFIEGKNKKINCYGTLNKLTGWLIFNYSQKICESFVCYHDNTLQSFLDGNEIDKIRRENPNSGIRELEEAIVNPKVFSIFTDGQIDYNKRSVRDATYLIIRKKENNVIVTTIYTTKDVTKFKKKLIKNIA